ncbi:MAG: dienelactone hydrolase family protein [Candidatus Brocadiales bacterium]
MIEETVEFSSEGLQLEGVLSYKEDLRCDRKVLLCPPHPNLGGNMDNNVILALARMQAENGFVTMRFNYRGVGKSQSHYKDFAENYKYWETTFGDGNLEGPLNDTKAALEFIKSTATEDSPRVFVVGYSLGAVMGMKIGVNEDSVKALVGIATPFGAYNFDFLEAYKRPKLFICSDNDFATKVEDTKVSTKKLSEPKELIIKTNTSHFYFGIEQELCQDVLRFLQQQP